MRRSVYDKAQNRRGQARWADGRRAVAFVAATMMALGLAACKKSEPVPAVPEDFAFSNLPVTLRKGDAIHLQARPTWPDRYEYRWMLRHGEGEWNWSAPWVRSFVYYFKPDQQGTYNIQVDIRRRGEDKPFIQKWLGSVYVGPLLVTKIIYSPNATALPAGSPIEFFVQLPRGRAPESLLFRLVESTATVSVIRDWQPWPMAPYPLPGNRDVIYLAMNVRLRDAPSVMQTVRLNAFYPYRDHPAGKANLLRLLISDNFGRLGRDEAIAALAEELSLALRLMASEYDGISAAGQEAALRTLPCVKDVQETKDDGGSWLALRLACGEVCEVNLERRLVREKDSPAFIEISLKRFPEYQRVFDLMKGQSEDARMAVALTFAVYKGYHYGTPPNYLIENVSDTVAHCGSLAIQLNAILTHLGVRPEFVELIGDDGSVHVLLQALLANKTWILDPTTGYVYLFDARRLGMAAIPDPIVLPQIRNLDALNLKRFYRKDSFKVLVSGDCVPAVIPLRPVNAIPEDIPDEP